MFIYIYHVPTLNTSCYGPVTAIEYCYRYDNADAQGSRQPNFSWKVLILEDTGRNNFVVNGAYVIRTHSPMNNANCTNSGNQTTCCDRTNINDKFNLPMNFIFGVAVAESALENTRNVKLLRFADAFLINLVDTRLVNKTNDQTLSVGSNITYTNQLPPRRGLLLLWFVIGKYLRL